MIELISYGFIVWHICYFIMNIVHKDRLTFIRVFRAICVALLFGKVVGEYLYEILRWAERLEMAVLFGNIKEWGTVEEQGQTNLVKTEVIVLGAIKTEDITI